MNKINWLLLILMFSPLVSALPEDWQQQLEIESDTAELDRKSGIVVYRGNVQLQQGTLSITADSILLMFNGDTLEQVVAEGNPAQYSQQVVADKPATEAQAKRIEYLAAKRELRFRGSAQLQQENNEFSGELIRYDVVSETVYASGTDTGSRNTSDEKQRIKVIIKPNRTQTDEAQDTQG